jgi:hypothetical protein
MDLKIITVIFMLANGQVDFEEYKIKGSCEDWYMNKLVHLDKYNINLIEGLPAVGFYCGVIETTPK